MVGPFVLAIVLAHPAVVPAAAGPPFQAPVTASQDQPWPPPGVVRPGDGITSPRLVKEFKPRYPAAAGNANIQGIVEMEVVVEADGTVGPVRVTRSLDTVHGLDEEAVKTVKKWRFEPGRKDGAAVPVVVDIEMAFTLRKSPKSIFR